MLRALFCVVVFTALFAACTSRSKNDTRNGGLQAFDPCEGRACGAECNACAPEDPNCIETPVVEYCTADGKCGQKYPECAPASGCTTNADCDAIVSPCLQCPNGAYACPFASCEKGQCVDGFETCGGLSCSIDADCPASGAPCQLCPDGSTACPYAKCEAGQCVDGFPGCGGFDPCADRACGDACAQCPPGDATCVESSVLKYCDNGGYCSAEYPVCGGSCAKPEDCPTQELCKPCSDGSCALVACVDSQCSWDCPVATNP